MHRADISEGGGGPARPGLPARPRGDLERPLFAPALALVAAFTLHAVLGAGMYFYARYRQLHAEPSRLQQALEVAVVEKPPPPAAKAEPVKPKPPKPKPVPMKVARAPQ